MPAWRIRGSPGTSAVAEVNGESSPVIVGVDTGGTFTDVIVRQPDGTLHIRKLPSTPADPSQSVLAGVRECQAAGLFASDYQVVHGTTVATNALLQRRGVPTALILTAGFRDTLAIGRQARLELYTFSPSRPAPLLPSSHCFELAERLDAQGQIVTPLDEPQADALLAELQSQGFQSLAVCFLFSYLNPVHEQTVGRLARLRGFDVSLSCEIAPEPREFERASTTAANAFVAPLMKSYLTTLQTQLNALDAQSLRVMQSNGGALSASEAANRAIATALSGPAGGVVAAARIGMEAGFPDLLTFDMGGTSTDVALILNGECPVVTSGMLGDLPLRAPLLDIHTVGAGGGSLARLDGAGGLRVGPQSAGADPGPVAYGKGETLTVTDANVLLGRLPEDTLLGGRVPLDGRLVRAHFDEFARFLNLSPEQAAMGIIAVANAAMARALRHVSVERGHDPAGLTLLAFGGSGGLHACDLADALGMQTILIPRYPGAFSALGLAFADARREYARAIAPISLTVTSFSSSGQAGDAEEETASAKHLPALCDTLNGLLSDLRERSEADRTLEGFAPAAWHESVLLDMRYIGQSFELRVPVAFALPDTVISEFALPIFTAEETSAVAAALSASILSEAARTFHALHRQRFGYADSGEPVEVTGLRLIAVGRNAAEKMETTAAVSLSDVVIPAVLAPPSDQSSPSVEGRSATTVPETRDVYIAGERQAIPLHQRAKLGSGTAFLGPALVVQEDAATYAAPGWQVVVDRQENMILRRTEATV